MLVALGVQEKVGTSPGGSHIGFKVSENSEVMGFVEASSVFCEP